MVPSHDEICRDRTKTPADLFIVEDRASGSGETFVTIVWWQFLSPGGISATGNVERALPCPTAVFWGARRCLHLASVCVRRPKLTPGKLRVATEAKKLEQIHESVFAERTPDAFPDLLTSSLVMRGSPGAIAHQSVMAVNLRRCA